MSGGSSPLVRGQLGRLTQIDETLRIIPARAGPTPNITLYSCDRPDHPRSCGANRVAGRNRGRVVGSSPLVRGQRNAVNLNALNTRIIPARAGPT